MMEGRKPPQMELVNLTDLKFHPRNYKKHPEDQLAHIRQSLREHGFYRNVVIARDNTILAGHGVVRGAAMEGIVQAPCIRLDLDPNEPRALKVVTGDNELGKLGEVDDRALTELLKEIIETDNLLGTGLDQEKLAALIFTTRPASEIRDINEASEWLGMPEYDEGDRKIQIIITFPSEEKREEFIKLTNLRIDMRKSKQSFTTRWPWTDRKDLQSTRFEL